MIVDEHKAYAFVVSSKEDECLEPSAKKVGSITPDSGIVENSDVIIGDSGIWIKLPDSEYLDSLSIIVDAAEAPIKKRIEQNNRADPMFAFVLDADTDRDYFHDLLELAYLAYDKFLDEYPSPEVLEGSYEQPGSVS